MQTLAILNADILAHILSFFNKTCEPREFVQFCTISKTFYDAAKLQAKQLFGDYKFLWHKYGQVKQKNLVSYLEIDATKQEQVMGMKSIQCDLQKLIIQGSVYAPANTLEYVPLLPNLQVLICKVIRDAILANIKWDMFANLQHLEIYEALISDIDALGAIKTLTRLDVSRNTISNISCLSQLTGLTSLDLSENKVTSVAPLKNLVKMKELNLSRNVFIDADNVIVHMTKLKRLDVRSTKLKTVQWISNLFETLTYLDISLNGDINDVSSLIVLNNLKWFDMSHCLGLEYADCLPGMTSLEYFRCQNTFIETFPFTSMMSHLRELDLALVYLTNVSFFARMPELRAINFVRHSYDDLSPIVHCQKLESIVFTHNTLVVPDASVLTQLPELLTVDVRYSNIMKIVATSPCFQKTTSINLSGNEIGNISCLQYATQLQMLNVSACAISDVSPISCLINLKELDIGENAICDISCLQGLTKLQRLEAQHNQIGTILPLMKLIELKVIMLHENEAIPVSELLSLAQALTNAKLFRIDKILSQSAVFPKSVDFFDPDIDY